MYAKKDGSNEGSPESANNNREIQPLGDAKFSSISKGLRQSATTRDSHNPQINFVRTRLVNNDRACSPKSRAIISTYS